jgi:hypothetical protein
VSPIDEQSAEFARARDYLARKLGTTQAWAAEEIRRMNEERFASLLAEAKTATNKDHEQEATEQTE